MSVVFLALAVLTGFLLVRIAWPGGLGLCRHDVLRLSVGSGLGLAIASVVAFAADALAGGSAVFVAVADVALFAVSLGLYLQFRRSESCPFCARAKSQAGWTVWGAAATAVASAVVIFGLFTVMNPYGEWDGWAIWNNHARFLASGATWKQMFAPPLVWSVQDYPLLVPGAIANCWMAAGSDTTVIPALVAAVFLFGSAGVLFGIFDLLRNRTQALIAVTALFGAAALIRMGASQYADVPAGFFYVTALAMLSIPDAFPEDRHSWWLAGLAAGCAAWTKNEGLVFVAVAILARVVASWRVKRLGAEWKRAGLIAAGAVPALAVVFWFKLVYAPPNYLFTEQRPLVERLGDVSRYMTVAVEFGRQLLNFGGWLVPPVIVAVGYLWLMGRRNEGGAGRTAALITLIAMTLAYASVYVFTTKDLNWQIDTSLARVLMQLWPAAVLVFFSYARDPEPEPAAAAQKSAPPRKRGRSIFQSRNEPESEV
jgi:hypothetical protein